MEWGSKCFTHKQLIATRNTNSNWNHKNHLHDGFKLHVKLLFYIKGMLSLLIMDVSGRIFSFRNVIFIKIDACAI